MVAAGWKPTVDNYLGRVTKPRILEAVREAKGEPSVQLIDHLKKGDMAREAERLLEGTGWLPEPLRLVEVGAVEQIPTVKLRLCPNSSPTTMKLPPTPTKNSGTSSRPNDPRLRGGFGRPAIFHLHPRARSPRRAHSILGEPS